MTSASYNAAIKEHARLTAQIYKARLDEIQKLAGFTISADGSNTAATGEDVRRYLKAVQTVGGPVAFISAKLLVTNAIHKLGLRPVSL